MNDEPRESAIRFTPRQSAIVANALAFLALAALVLLVGALLFFGLRFVAHYSEVLLPPVAAVILAKVVQPLFDRCRRGLLRLAPPRLVRSRALHGAATGAAIVLVLLAILVPIGAFCWFFGKLVADQLAGLAGRVPDAIQWSLDKIPDLKAYLVAHDLMPLVKELDPASWFDVGAIAEGLRTRAFGIVGRVPALIGSVTSWLMVLVYLIFYLASRPIEGSDFSRVLLGTSERTRGAVRFLVDEFIRIVVAFFRGQVVVAIIEGALFGLGFQFLAGLPYGLTLGLLVGLVNIVPYMGSIFVMPPVCLFAFFGPGGGWWTLLLVLASWAAVGLADFYITPKIVGDRTGLSNFAVVFSLLFWGSVIGGFAGVFLAVPLSAFIAVAYRFVAREYFSKPVAPAAELPAPAAESAGPRT